MFIDIILKTDKVCVLGRRRYDKVQHLALSLTQSKQIAHHQIFNRLATFSEGTELLEKNHSSHCSVVITPLASCILFTLLSYRKHSMTNQHQRIRQRSKIAWNFFFVSPLPCGRLPLCARERGARGGGVGTCSVLLVIPFMALFLPAHKRRVHRPHDTVVHASPGDTLTFLMVGRVSLPDRLSLH